MKKIYTKLIVIVLQLILAVSVVGMSSYAWMVLSSSPTAEGIQITIGGGNTILVAADVSETVDGVTYHYPAAFGDTLNFSQYDKYDYLKTMDALTPVSTADGLNWFIPDYYDPSDPEVESGAILTGTMKSIQEFTLDEFLNFANLSAEEADLIAQGSYIYLDFWVVSPGEDYTLRISTGDDSGGSFVIGLPEAVSTGDGYTLNSESSGASACVRVGLLANSDDLIDNTMLYYQDSPAFDGRYNKLRGAYTEPDAGWKVYSDNYRFTIYEPNGGSHPYAPFNDGTYVVTRPIGLVNGAADWVDVNDRLTVQLSSGWTMSEVGEGTQLEQRFQTALLEPSFRGLSEEKLTAKFYSDYLGGQVTPYVTKGWFVKNTQNLYNVAATNQSRAPLDELAEDHLAGATDDVYIVKLEKNIPQRIRMFIWLEGTDVDCVNGVSASSIAMRIELAGSNMEESN